MQLQHPILRLVHRLPALRVQTWEEALEKMGRYNMMPATNRALDAAGASVIMPAKYLKREVIKGALGPVGRFGSPAPTRANASTLHLFGAGLSSFADWQVRFCTCAASLEQGTEAAWRRGLSGAAAPGVRTGGMPCGSLSLPLVLMRASMHVCMHLHTWSTY